MRVMIVYGKSICKRVVKNRNKVLSTPQIISTERNQYCETCCMRLSMETSLVVEKIPIA